MPDAEAAARAAALRLAEAARGGEEIALSGGSTPRPAYEHAARLEPDWSRAGIWWADERCVPPDDDRSNFRLVRESLLERLGRSPRAVHRVPVARGCEEAADAYDAELRPKSLDFVLLGIGRDGHTASLFPRAPALAERERLAVRATPGLEPHVERVTLTIPALEAARTLVFLVVGADKADAVRRAFAEAPSALTPASLVRSRAGSTVLIVDSAAAAGLDTR